MDFLLIVYNCGNESNARKGVFIISDIIMKLIEFLFSKGKSRVNAHVKRKALEQSFSSILDPIKDEPFFADIEKLVATDILQTQLISYCADVPQNGSSIAKRCNDIASAYSTDRMRQSQLYGVLYKLAFSVFYIINDPSDADIKMVMNSNNQNTADLREEIHKLADHLAALRKALFEAEHKQAQPAPSIPTIINLPPKNEFFTCRESLLDLIEKNFTGDCHTQYLHGGSGVGKTQIALAYALRHQADYERIVWIHAETENTILDSYQKFIHVMHLIDTEKQNPSADEILQCVFGWMETHDKFLFIYDNVEDIPGDCTWWPRCACGHLLITTQKTVLPIQKQIHVLVFTPEEALAFLEKRTKRTDPENMAALAKRLGRLPLALEQAAAYIDNNPGTGFLEYLLLLDTLGLAVFEDTEGVIQYQLTVTATMELAMRRIGLEAANQLLNLCAYLASDNITPDLFSANAALLPEPLQSQLADPLSANKVWRELSRYSLLETRESEQGYAIHRLLQEVVRRKLEGDLRWARCWLEIFRRAFDFEYGKVDSHTRFQQLLPHVEAFLQAADSVLPEKSEQLQIAKLFSVGGVGQIYLGNYSQALTWYYKELTIREKVLGAGHPDTAASYNNIALVYDHQGDYQKALEWYFKALPICEKVLGAWHPDTATTYNNIALVYDHQGDYQEALEWHFKALPICEKVLGAGHPNTATTYNNIASVYDNQCDYQKALEWYFKALPICEKVLGAEHPSTATTYNNIALVYDNQCDYQKALEWHFKALPIRERVLGAEHPDTATTYNNIASVYDHQGDYQKALEWYFKALPIWERALGAEHPNTAATHNNIASVYNHQCDYQKALEWYFKALPIRERVLGAGHPDTATTYNNIASVYDNQGDYQKALEWYFKALPIWERVLGTEHPNTADIYNNIALVYDNQGDYQKALEWYFKALPIWERVLGTEHPNTADTYNNIALVYDNQGDYQKALEWYFKALPICESVLGSENPSTAATYNNIASVYYRLGENKKALPFIQKAYAILKNKLGEEHPKTKNAENNMRIIQESLD